MKKLLTSLLLTVLLLLSTRGNVTAVETVKMGVHILHPSELQAATDLISVGKKDDSWQYITIPFTLDDLDKQDEWQAFFDASKDQKVIPLVRLATRVENGAWVVPTQKDIIEEISFLSALNWPTEDRHIIVFNEVNHAKEWGGGVNPSEYAALLAFTANWAHSEGKNYVVLPAAMDLAAPNGGGTQEAFSYLSAMYNADPSIFTNLDAWNSHSYPNPGFSSAPQKSGKNSLRGFQYELAYLKDKNTRDLSVYITETGWTDTRQTGRWLTNYYLYALQHIWSDDRVIAVTPFVFKGAPGPFEGFSFVTGDDKPTRQYQALQTALAQFYGKKTASSE